IPKNATWAEIYNPAMDVQTEQEAADYLAAVVAHHQKYFAQSDRAKAERIVLANIGYWSGYCSDETAQRVLRLYKTEHPVFGRRRPTAEEAFAAGVTMAKVWKQQQEKGADHDSETLTKEEST